MAQKTMIDGTAYEISGGKTMVDGTVYTVNSGKTMVDGTVYEIPFVPKIKTITLTLSYNELISEAGALSYANVKINGTTYYKNGTYTFETEDELTISVYVNSSRNYRDQCFIRLNGTDVQNGIGTYTFATSAESIKISFATNGAYYAIITTS